MNAVAAIVRANLRRLVNDRGNIFFLIILPLLIVFALGSAIGSSESDVVIGVVDPAPSKLSATVGRTLAASEGITLEDVSDAGSLRRRVSRGEFNAGYVVSASGAVTTITWVSGLDTRGIAMQGSMQSVVQTVAAHEQVIGALDASAGLTRQRATAVVDGLTGVPAVRVSSTTVGGDETSAESIRAVLAGGELTLFMFLSALFGSQALLMSRLLGVTRRTSAAPVSVRTIVIGEAVSRYIVAMLQGLIIIVGTMVLFGVDWHSPLAVLALSAAMALVGTGAAMLLGTFGRSEQQVGALALLVGLVFAALGGSMQPLEFFPQGMRQVAFAITPHAWMNDGLWKILVDGAGLRDVLPAVGVLTGGGVVLLAIASRALARRLV